MKLQFLISTLLSLIYITNLYAQDTSGISISVDTLPPHPSAILELKHVAKGFLPTRLSTTQKQQINSPAKGLLVYDTTMQQYSFFKDTAWQVMGGGDVWQSDNNVIHYNSGLVGIGTDMPTYQLEVSGRLLLHYGDAAITIDTNFFDTGSTGIGLMMPNADTSGVAVMGVFNDTNNNGMGVAMGYTSYNRNNFLNIDSSRISLSYYEDAVSSSSLNIDKDQIGIGYYDEANANNYSSLWVNDGMIGINRKSSAFNTQTGAYFNNENLLFSVADINNTVLNSNVFLSKQQLSLSHVQNDSVTNFYMEKNFIELGLHDIQNNNSTHNHKVTFNRNGTIHSNTMSLDVNGLKTSTLMSTNGSGTWKLGKKVSATVQLVTTDYIEVEIDGVIYKLALVQ